MSLRFWHGEIWAFAWMAVAGGLALGSPADAFKGRWGGTLVVGDLRLPIEYHISTTARGSMTATMDSPDQGAFDIPTIARIEGENGIWLEVRPIGATFEGALDHSSGSVTGAWKQAKQHFPLTLRKLAGHSNVEQRSPEELAASQAAGKKICGVWEGSPAEEGTVRIKIWRSVALAAAGTIDVPAKSAYNVPLRKIRLEGDKVRFVAPGIGAAFEGELTQDASALSGRWVQAGRRMAVELRKLAPPDYSRAQR